MTKRKIDLRQIYAHIQDHAIRLDLDRDRDGYAVLDIATLREDAYWWVVLGTSLSGKKGSEFVPRILTWDNVEEAVADHEDLGYRFKKVYGWACSSPKHASYVYNLVKGLEKIDQAAKIASEHTVPSRTATLKVASTPPLMHAVSKVKRRQNMAVN